MGFLNIKEVADYFRVSEMTIRRWIKSGNLKAYKFGTGETGSIRIDEAEIKRFVEKHKK